MMLESWRRMMPLRRLCARAGVSGWLMVGLLGLALAATNFSDFLKAIAQRESSLNPNATNSYGYVGLFQMGTAAMTDAGYYKSSGTPANSWQGTFTGKNGLTSLAQFKANPDLQVKAITDYYAKLQNYIDNYGLDQYAGKTLNGVPITMSGLVAGAHLVGIGALKQYLQSGGAYVPVDGNKVPITQYISQFGGYNLSSTAPTYAQVLAANPTGSVTVSPQPSQPPPGPGGNGQRQPNMSSIFPSQPTDTMSPEDAFYARSGYTMWQVSDFLKQGFGALLFLWAAFSVYGGFQSYRSGRATLRKVMQQKIHAVIVVAVYMAMML
jgi:hypothetical protein